MKVVGAAIERILPHDAEKARSYLALPAVIVNWHPWVEKVSLFEKHGFDYRRIVLFGGQTELVEKFWQDEHAGNFHFQVVKGLWMEELYRSKISVEARDGSCVVSWQGRLMTDSPEDESDQMEAFYEEGLSGFEAFLESC